MFFYRSKEFTASEAWDSQHIASFDNVSIKLHWTDKPYKWHINDGQEVFAVMDGSVEMRYKEDGQIKSKLLHTGDIFYAKEGTEHVAHPQGIARVLVIEREGSI
ncbi:cupin [Klebsiella sp. T2.Ur]|uniref:cupin n=1 Tax=Klebsiella aerogenes TaxID=548 RepID=UPI000735C8F4|nr:cupin [Klebsiella aerogenes]KTJ39463.1 cupin [Klebsiella aerogenes]MCL6722920.1 cupin [Klebsiella sp. T2.Ur]HCL5637805.1 cupin [Klebsiella aerogenes]